MIALPCWRSTGRDVQTTGVGTNIVLERVSCVRAQTSVVTQHTLCTQVKNRDEQLAKAKRMLVAVNNKWKQKFAKKEQETAASAAVPGQEGASQQELDKAKAQLAASQRTVEELQRTCDELRAAADRQGKSGDDVESPEGKDAEISELREAVEERDAIIQMAKEKYQEMGQKAKAAIEARDGEIASLNEQLEKVAYTIVRLQHTAMYRCCRELARQRTSGAVIRGDSRVNAHDTGGAGAEAGAKLRGCIRGRTGRCFRDENGARCCKCR